MPIPGVTLTVVDEPVVAGAPTDTSTAFLLTTDADAPATPTRIETVDQARDILADADTARLHTETILRESQTGTGAADVIVLQVGGGVGGLQAALDLLGPSYGPGQVVVPESITAADHAVIAEWAFSSNRVALLNGPTAATTAQLQTLAQATIDTGDGRNASLWADTAIVPGTANTTHQVPWAVVQAGIIARNDIGTPTNPEGNPGQPAAGDNGIAQWATGLLAERDDTDTSILNAGQVNVARAQYGGAPRAYGYRTLADLDVLGYWWDLSGARVVMDVRAHSLAASERIVFGQIDAGGHLQAKWHGLLAARCLELLRIGALFGDETTAFRVETGPALNPVSDLQDGVLRAEVRLKTSPFAEDVQLTIVRQPLTA